MKTGEWEQKKKSKTTYLTYFFLLCYPKAKKKKIGFREHGKKKKGLVGRNEILFYFKILFFDTANPNTTVDPLAVTMLVLSTGRCISWNISVTVMVLW
jgi:hypothetical protein